jgi:hypothetical protein
MSSPTCSAPTRLRKGRARTRNGARGTRRALTRRPNVPIRARIADVRHPCAASPHGNGTPPNLSVTVRHRSRAQVARQPAHPAHGRASEGIRRFHPPVSRPSEARTTPSERSRDHPDLQRDPPQLKRRRPKRSGHHPERSRRHPERTRHRPEYERNDPSSSRSHPNHSCSPWHTRCFSPSVNRHAPDAFRFQHSQYRYQSPRVP